MSKEPVPLQFQAANPYLSFIDSSIGIVMKKIAVIGTARSGKTVFLTSSIDQLRLQGIMINGQIPVAFNEIKLQKSQNTFNYEGYRNELELGNWPVKTTSISHYRCRFNLGIKRRWWQLLSRKKRVHSLHFMDLPGERFADAAIAEHASFEDWSDEILKYINNNGLGKHAQKLMALQNGQNVFKNDLFDAYREALAEFIINFKPMISPSTFLLQSDGRLLPAGLTKNDINIFRALAKRDGILGIKIQKNKLFNLKILPGKMFKNQPVSFSCEFAPLSSDARKNNTKLTAELSKNYKEYRRRVVMPLFTSLQGSNCLIVLVDIPTLLNGGVQMFNDNVRMIESLFGVLRNPPLINKLPGINKIERVAFVATKSDLVLPDDLGRLEKLLKDMTSRFATLPGVAFEWFCCSSVVSTQPDNGGQKLVGKLIDGDGQQAYVVPRLPKDWPADWEAKAYKIPSVFPKFPKNKFQPPQQKNLDDLYKFICQ